MSGQEMRVGAFIGAGIIAVGSFMPWASVTIGLGTINKNGIDGDGKITLVLAGLGALGIWRLGGALWLSILCGALTSVIAYYNGRDLNGLFGSEDNIADAAIGIYAVFVGGIVLALCALSLHAEHKRRPAPGSPLPPPPLPSVVDQPRD
jgi:hypothetical protein